MKHIEDLYELCDIIDREIADATAKVSSAGGMTAGDLDYIDKLTHTMKSLKTIIAMIEAEDDGWSYDDGRMMPHGGTSYARDGRGRGSRAKRTATGRYSSRGYSRADGVREMLRKALDDAENEHEREAIRKALDEMER